MTTPLPTLASLQAQLLTLTNALSKFENQRYAQRYTKSSADNQVTAVVDGLLRVVSVSVSATALATGAVTLANSLRTVVNAAIDLADTATRSASATFASSLALPGLPAQGGVLTDYPNVPAFSVQAEMTSLSGAPCESSLTYTCRAGGAVVIVSSKRRVTSLTFDTPLSTNPIEVADWVRQALNCADAKASDPADDPIVNDVTGAISAPSLSSLALYANGTMRIEDRGRIRSLQCANWSTIVNAGTGATTLGVELEAGNVFSKGAVTLRDRVKIHGFIRTSGTLTKGNGDVIDGPEIQNTTLNLPKLALTVPFPASPIGTIEVDADKQQTAGPGYYSKLKLQPRAQAFLRSGVYYFNEVLLEPDSKVWLDQTAGPVIVYVKTSFTYRGEFKVADNSFPRLFIGYLGMSTAIVERVFRGTLSAPSAKISLASVAQNYEGAFHGKDIEIAFPDFKLCHRPFELRYSALPGATATQ
jgi:DNA-binding protein YbaB